MKKFTRFILLFILLLTAVQAQAENISGGYTASDGTKYDLLKGAFTFPSAVLKSQDGKDIADISARFFYSDGFFAEDPYKYNTHLATASLCMAMAGFYSNVGAVGKDADYSRKWINIYNYMRAIGVAEDAIYRNVYNSIRPQTDSIGVTIGSMKQTQNKDRTLIIISIRGSNYEKEWTSNVTLGGDKSKEAAGFSSAAEIVFNNIKNYIASKKLDSAVNDGTVDFWISGYSRAGATANLTARRLVDTYITALNNNGNKVFAYCNEAPQGGIESMKNPSSDYSCIHNVINKNDLVPYVAPKGMNFLRYGVDHYIPGSDADYKAGNNYDNEFYSMNNANYSLALAKMTRQLAMVNPDITFDDKFQTKGLDTKIFSLLRKKFIQDGSFYLLNDYLDTLFMNYLTGWTSVDRAKYAADIQTALRDYMAVLYDATPQQSALFTQRLKGMIDNDIGVRDALGIVRYALGKWHRPGYKYKKYYTDKLINMMNDNKCFEALELDESVKQKLIRVDLPFILDFIMTFASVDYDNNFYDTRGLTQLLTLVMNLTNIFLNHAPEVTLAWLRSYDSLYDGETGVVTSASFAISDNYKLKYSESLDDNNNAILDIGDVDDAFATRGTEPYTVLPKTVTAGYSNGGIKELNIDWDKSSVKWYSHAKEVSEDLWTEIPADDLTEALRGPEALKAEFTGKVNTSGAALAEGVSDEVTGSVYIAGLVRLDTPDASLPDGEYYGSQLVSLMNSNADGKIIYSLSELFEYDDGSMGGGGMFPEEYKGAVKIGSDDAKGQHHYMLNAWVESSNSNLSADSEIMVWEYIINPASDDSSSDQVGRTRSHTFVYSKDIAVFWRIMSSEVKVTGSNANLAELQDTIYINPAPYDAETVKTRTFDVTVITIAGTTLKGVYNIPVQYSEDGVTWTDAAVMKFNTVTGSAEDGDSDNDDDDSDNDGETSSNGSSSGCNSGVLSSALFALIAMSCLTLRKS